MTPDRAAEGHTTPDQLAAWVDDLRAAQGLPRRVTNPTSLQRIADLMRTTERSPTSA